MGSRNASQVFQFLAEKALQPAASSFHVYIDDLSGAFDSFSEGMSNLEALFKRVEKANLKLGLKKSRFFSKEITMFGFKLSKIGYTPDPERVKSLVNMGSPKSQKELLSIVASFNYFRSAVESFSRIAAPLYTLTGSNVAFKWEKTHESAFLALKRAISNAILITRPCLDEPFWLDTDASVEGIGCVLKQKQNGKMVVLGCASSSVKGAERNWSICNLELKAVHFGLTKFSKWIGSNLVRIRTDNSFVYFTLYSGLERLEVSARTPAVRALLYISTFNYIIEHVAGITPDFLLADLLSRTTTDGEDGVLQLSRSSKDNLLTVRKLKNEVAAGPVLMVSVTGQVALKDAATDWAKVIVPDQSDKQMLESIKLAQSESELVGHHLRRGQGGYIEESGILFKVIQGEKFLFCPPLIGVDVVKSLHLPGHLSARAVINKLTSLRVWLPGKYRLAMAVTRNCKQCDPAKSHATLSHESTTKDSPVYPFQTIHIDLCHFGDANVLVIVDQFSEFLICRKLRSANSVDIRDTLLAVFCQFGLPAVVVSDNGRNLNSNVMSELYETLGIRLSNSSVANSRGNYLAEYAVKRVQEYSRIYQPRLEELELFLQVSCFMVNGSPRSDRRQLSNFEAFFGRARSWPLQLPNISKSKKGSLDSRMSKFIDQAQQIRDEMLQVFVNRRDKLSFDETQKLKLKVGDHVRAKRWQLPGQLKKLFRPFSEDIFVVKSFSRWTGVAELVKLDVEPGERPISFKRHCRFLVKVPRLSNDGADDLVIPERAPVEVSNTGEEGSPSWAEQMKNEDSGVVKLDNQALLDVVERQHQREMCRNTHGMTLRSRRPRK